MKQIQQSSNIDLIGLTTFLSVTRHLNFREAAAELNITPSAVSHAIRALERRLNARLFNRTTRSVSLTDAGERLAKKLKPAIAAVEEAVRTVDEHVSVPSGTVRINASEGAIRLVLRPVLGDFVEQFPQVHLDIVSDGSLGDIVSEGFDAGIRLIEAVPSDMVAIVLTTAMRFAAVGSPKYFAKHGRPLSPRDLTEHNCIRFRLERGGIYRWEFERHGIADRINVTGPITLTDQPLMVDAAIQGIGIAFVPEYLVVEPLADGRLNRVLEEWCPEFPGLALYYPGHRHVPSGLKALIRMLQEKNCARNR